MDILLKTLVELLEVKNEQGIYTFYIYSLVYIFILCSRLNRCSR